jgi:hypothetical protein
VVRSALPTAVVPLARCQSGRRSTCRGMVSQ